MPLSIDSRPEYGEAWDCDLFFVPENMSFDIDLDEEDDTGDWQVITLDRFHDRNVNPELGNRSIQNNWEG